MSSDEVASAHVDSLSKPGGVVTLRTTRHFENEATPAAHGSIGMLPSFFFPIVASGSKHRLMHLMVHRKNLNYTVESLG